MTASLPEEMRESWRKKIVVVHVKGVTPDGPCWLWTGYRSDRGYGRVCIPNKAKCGYIHRVVYELLVGPIPAGLQLDHLCRQHACCNPAHLEPVTGKVNCERGSKATKTHCPQNHPYSGDNLRIHVDKRGYHRRICVTCNREKCAAHRSKRREYRESTWGKYWPTDAAMELAS